MFQDRDRESKVAAPIRIPAVTFSTRSYRKKDYLGGSSVTQLKEELEECEKGWQEETHDGRKVEPWDGGHRDSVDSALDKCVETSLT